MARISYLLRRGASYYARIKVPLDLVEIVGKKELVKALGTKEEKEARRRLLPIVDGWTRQFDDLQSRRNLTPDDKAAATWQHYQATLERDEQNRRSMPSEADIEAATEKATAEAIRSGAHDAGPIAAINAMSDVELLANKARLDARHRAARLKRLRTDLAHGETMLIEQEVEDYVEENKLIVDPLSPDRGDLAGRLMRAEIEALERTLERDRGDYSGTPSDPIVKPATGTARETAAPGESIMELFATYARENPRGIRQDTLDQARRDVGLFVDHVGSTFPVHRISKKEIREWKALLIRFPVKATESKAFAGMKIGQIVKRNETVGKPVITPRTVNRHLASLGAFCRWLAAHGYIDQNPVTDMHLAKEKKVSTLPFTVDQLNTLFRSPLFTGCRSADEWRNVAKPGNVTIRDHRFWTPLIMLYSGARPAEIAQLAVADVRQQHGHWIFHITTEGDGDKSVKTAGSMRVVPIHSELIRLGFLDYHAAMKKAGETRLFPEAKRNSRGQMIADFSREFGRYLTRIGMKDGRGLSLYSFRHGAADAFRRGGFMDEQFAPLIGHAKATMTARYGQLPQGTLKQRVEIVEAISYPGLDLEHLRK